MVGYTPHRSVTIYPFKSSNETRCTPTCRSWLYNMPGTGFSSKVFSSARMHFIFSSPYLSFSFFCVVFVPDLGTFVWPITVGSRTLRCHRTMYSVRPGHDTYTLCCIAAIHVFFTDHPAAA